MGKRLDVYLFEKGFFISRQRAKQEIAAGNVTVGGNICKKPGLKVNDDIKVTVTGTIHEYVSRGGLKLKKALHEFKIDIKGAVCLDIGASTGGFTDCMLINGAKKVFAVDVGHGQLADKLKNDKRVVNMEGTDIRNVTLDDIKGQVDFISTDLSFISLKLIFPKVKELLKNNGKAVLLIKPQFEAGRKNIGKKGIVKDIHIHEKVCGNIKDFAVEYGFECEGLCTSPIKGGSGNTEYLICIKTL